MLQIKKITQTIARIARREEAWVYLFIFLLSLQTRWIAHAGALNGGYWEYATISVYAVDVVIGILLARRLRLAIQTGGLQRWFLGGARRSTFWLVAGVLELAIVISILYAAHDGLALYGYLRFLLGMGLAWLVLSSRVTAAGVSAALLASGAVQGFLALVQMGMQRVVASTLLGMAEQAAGTPGVSVVELADERWLRAYGSLPHPNILGGWLALVLVAGMAWQIRQLMVRAHGKKNNTAVIWLGWLALAVTAAGVVVSFSRTAQLAAAVGVLVQVGGVLILKHAAARRAVLTVAGVIAVAALAMAGVWHEQIATRYGGSARVEVISFDERARYAQDARAIIAAHPLGGAGMHNYGLAVHDAIDDERPAYGYEPVHNTLLLVWAEVGVVGLLAYVALLAYLCALAVTRRNPVALALLATLATLLFFDHWLWSLPFGLYAWWLCLALAQRYMAAPRRRA